MNYKLFTLPQSKSKIFNLKTGFYALIIILFSDTYFHIYPILGISSTVEFPELIKFLAYFFLGLYIVPEIGKQFTKLMPLLVTAINPKYFGGLFEWGDKNDRKFSYSEVIEEAIRTKNSIVKQIADETKQEEKNWNILQNAFFAAAYLIPLNIYHEGLIVSVTGGDKSTTWLFGGLISLVFLYLASVYKHFYVDQQGIELERSFAKYKMDY